MDYEHHQCTKGSKSPKEIINQPIHLHYILISSCLKSFKIPILIYVDEIINGGTPKSSIFVWDFPLEPIQLLGYPPYFVHQPTRYRLRKKAVFQP